MKSMKNSDIEKEVKYESAWWKEAIFYQIYPLSFADGNGDGKGDFLGIIQRLDYLRAKNKAGRGESLNVDAIYLNPIFKSAMIDFGFDVTDYWDVDPVFGTMADFELLLKEAHARGLKVIMEMILNHTSSLHPWFLESRSSLDNPKRDWYIWHNPDPEQGYPTNWYSFNGSSAWHLDEMTNQYYYATFDSRQPDLNWHNPEVRTEMLKVVRFWLEKGVDGFRLDAYNALGHDPEFRDNPYKYEKGPQDGMDGQYPLYTQDLPIVHSILKEIRAMFDKDFPGAFLTGETLISSGPNTSFQYFGKNNDELHSPLDFNRFAHTPWAPLAFHKTIEEWERTADPQNWPCYWLGNHDITRYVSRWSKNVPNQNMIARIAAAFEITIRGTPFIYQGEEIAMSIFDIPLEESKDFLGKAGVADNRVSRDSNRTPIQWDDTPYAGFSFGREIKPWLPVNPDYKEKNIAAQIEKEGSIWQFYHKLIALRQSSPAIKCGTYQSCLETPNKFLCYLRQCREEIILVVLNFAPESVEFQTDTPLPKTGWKVLLASNICESQIDLPTTLRPFEVIILGREKM